MRFASLASGSKGNCLVAEAGATRVMLDCGLAPPETARRLARLGLAPHDIHAILVTHEHGDHADGAFAFAAAHGQTVCLTQGTLQALRKQKKTKGGVQVRIVEKQSPLSVQDLQVHPFGVPHDAADPVQYVLSDGARRLGVLTDIGAPTAQVEAALSGCDALVLECNHELEMLWSGGYPTWLKERIAGPLGHLCNGDAGRLLGAIDRSRLQHVIAAHLSQQNNRPELARAALARALGCGEEWVAVASQDEGLGWRGLG